MLGAKGSFGLGPRYRLSVNSLTANQVVGLADQHERSGLLRQRQNDVPDLAAAWDIHRQTRKLTMFIHTTGAVCCAHRAIEPKRSIISRVGTPRPPQKREHEPVSSARSMHRFRA